MLQAKELKIGLFVWWSAQDGAWSCPCVVTAINKRRGFKVRSLDNFYESGWLRLKDDPHFDKSRLHEMQECSREDIEQYFKTSTQELRNKVVTIKSKLVAAQKYLAVYKKRVSEFLMQSAIS